MAEVEEAEADQKMASYEERILKAIEDSEVGLTTVDVAKQAGVSKTTAIKYLSVLKSEGKCEFVEVGPSKLWRSARKPEELGESREDLSRDDLAGLKEVCAAFGRGEVVEMRPLNFSVIAQLEDLSDDVIVSFSFKVKPEKVGALESIMKKWIRQPERP
ncbi:MAG TPA: FaeA/PapI family transcriptional regulator [Methanothrix sp.]|nr:FaeA/PapI family transcriptional regulator [Methanothrix sp.]